MLRDAEHFKTKLGALDGAKDTGTYLVKLVSNKHVPEPVAAPELEEVTPINGNGTETGNGINGEDVKISSPVEAEKNGKLEK